MVNFVAQPDGYDIKAVVQVFPEEFFLDELFEVLVCCGDDTDIHWNVLGGAHHTDFLFLEHPQELHLH